MTLEELSKAYYAAFWGIDTTNNNERDIAGIRAALLWLAERMEENGELTTDCKRAAVSAYLAKGQEGRGVVEPVRLMKAISAALRAAAKEAVLGDTPCHSAEHAVPKTASNAEQQS